MTPYISTHKLSQFEWTAVGIAVIVVLAAVYLSGCATGLADTYASLSVQARALQVATKALPSVCEQRQMECVNNAVSREETDTCRTLVKRKCDAAAKTIEGSQQATLTARDMLQAVPQAAKAPRNVMSWVGVAIRLYTDVSDALAQLGYSLGG